MSAPVQAHYGIYRTPVCSTKRTWLARADRQLVRSEASWPLCSLIRFSAWPRAQYRVSYSHSALPVRRLITTQRMSSPREVASILAATRRLHPHDFAVIL
jgi:hypothetical protein